MINKSDILQLVKHIHRKDRGVPDRQPMHPRREWLIGVAVFLMVIIVGIVLSARSFENYQTIDTKVYTVDAAVPSYNQTLAGTVLSYYKERKQAYEQLVGRVTTSVSTDPAATSTATTTDATVMETEIEVNANSDIEITTDAEAEEESDTATVTETAAEPEVEPANDAPVLLVD